jgi:translation initiation factor IF-2
MKLKKYVEIYQGMPAAELAKALNVSVADVESSISSLEDMMCAVQIYGAVPICFTNAALLELTLTTYNQVDLFRPTVTVMGHINHGKSSVVEALTAEAICDKEAGKITQATSIYQMKDNKFLLVDTPGHNVLGKMREIMIPISEIVVIVVAANTGIQDQTIKIIEQTNHKDRILCVNKIDLPNRVPNEEIYRKCASYGLTCSQYSEYGDVPVVHISVKEKKHLNDLVQCIHTLIDERKYKTDIYRHAVGYILNSFIQAGRGRMIRVLLKAGACKIGDEFCLNASVHSIGRMFINGIQAKKTDYAIAGDFVDIVCDAKCTMGTLFFIINNAKMQNSVCRLQLITSEPLDAARLFAVYVLNAQQRLVLTSILPKNSIVRVNLNNNVTDEDIAFAREQGVSMIIWHKISVATEQTLHTNKIKYLASENLLIGTIEEFLAPPVEVVEEKKIIGTACIKAVFHMKKDIIIGCDVKSGKILIGNKIMVKKDDVLITEGTIRSLQHKRENIEEAKMGIECGIVLKDAKADIEYEVGMMVECIEA